MSEFFVLLVYYEEASFSFMNKKLREEPNQKEIQVSQGLKTE